MPTLPDGVRLYAVGDIHGRADLLRRIHTLIAEDEAETSVLQRKIIVYLGDYIDRGDDSKGVIDLLLDEPLLGYERVFLKGNHEAEFQDFLVNPTAGHVWTQYGGLSTALSYQVRVPGRVSAEQRMRELRDQMLEAVPQNHHSFFTSLRFRYELGDFFFVHAGIRPGLPLGQQKPPDLLWIREPFLTYKGRLEKMVVHGHSITELPFVSHNRIGIDTGAYHSGHLTCLVLEGATRRFLVT
ncbi:MAG: serine/threonine protein phosphatase [Magnetococcales bacterium]|nr:serine/threonine protein phosphatase [Magnetococcales bacterium]MBF0438804.1 serine/threonine protein phosphatase [Magnetococcales bacterium]